MAERTQIEVIITPEGEVRVKTEGLRGQACLEETAALEKALGRVKSRTRTGEYWQQGSAKSGVKTRS